MEMGHPHRKPTPVTIDNATADGLTMKTMTPKASKSKDMRFQWLKCCGAQRMFQILWCRGPLNRADYPSKHHFGCHHLGTRGDYIVDKALPAQ